MFKKLKFLSLIIVFYFVVFRSETAFFFNSYQLSKSCYIFTGVQGWLFLAVVQGSYVILYKS